jgi:hypothetical protein
VRCKSRTNCSTPAAPAATRFSSSIIAINPAGSKLQTIRGAGEK